MTEGSSGANKIGSYTYRPKAGSDIDQYLENLTKQTGAGRLAVEHCIKVSMAVEQGKSPEPPAARQDDGQLRKLEALIKAEQAKNSALQQELNNLKSKPAPEVKSPLEFTPDETSAIAKIMAKRRLQTIREAISYSIKYTIKNDWL